MEWFSFQGRRSGIDTIWWSEHDHSFRHNARPGRFGLPVPARHVGPLPLPVKIGGKDQPELEIVPVTIDKPANEAFSDITFSPLYALPRVTLKYKSPGRGRLRLNFHFSWHPGPRGIPRRHRFQLTVGGRAAPAHLKREGLVVQRVKRPELAKDGSRTLVVELGGPGFLLPDDNVFGSLEIIPENMTVELLKAGVTCRKGGPTDILGARAALAASNSATYDTVEFVGTEYSGTEGEYSDPMERVDGQTHFNVYLPQSSFVREAKLPGLELARRIHAKGGLIALNHPFGAGGFATPPDDGDERVRNCALYLLSSEVSAFGVDLLEVGYMKGRGGMDLAGHLLLWDLLVANRRFLDPVRTIGAVGVTDSHGEGEVGNQCTFLLPVAGQSARPSRSQALLQLRRRRMFFGYPRTWYQSGFPIAGFLDFKIGDLKMGAEGVPGAYDQAATPLVVTTSPLPPGSVLKLIELPIVTGPQPDVTVTPVVSDVPATVDTSASKAFRLELRTDSGDVIVVTNHIVVLR